MNSAGKEATQAQCKKEFARELFESKQIAQTQTQRATTNCVLKSMFLWICKVDLELGSRKDSQGVEPAGFMTRTGFGVGFAFGFGFGAGFGLGFSFVSGFGFGFGCGSGFGFGSGIGLGFGCGFGFGFVLGRGLGFCFGFGINCGCGFGCFGFGFGFGFSLGSEKSACNRFDKQNEQQTHDRAGFDIILTLKQAPAPARKSNTSNKCMGLPLCTDGSLCFFG